MNHVQPTDEQFASLQNACGASEKAPKLNLLKFRESTHYSDLPDGLAQN
jgi:hypothetical protein